MATIKYQHRDENGQLHCEDGPAAEWANGDQWWLIHGKFHREGGPAIAFTSGYGEWYRHGVCYYRGRGTPPLGTEPSRFNNTLREWDE